MKSPVRVRRSIRVSFIALAVAGLALVGVAPASADVPAVHPVTGSPANASSYTELGGLLYLAARTPGGSGADTIVWSFDGTTFTPLLDSPVGVRSVVAFDGDLYVVAPSVTLSGNPYALYVYDGATFTETATPLLDASDFFVFDDALYFSALVSPGVSSGWALSGGVLTQIAGDYTNPRYFSAFDGTLYFNGDTDPSGGVAPFVFSYDLASAPAPAVEVPGSPYNPGRLTAVGEVAYLGGSNSFFSFDGTTFTEIPFAPLERVEATVVLDGVLFFNGYDGSTFALYTYAGGEFTAVPGGARPSDSLAVFGGRVYFSADDTLVSTDGGAVAPVAGGPRVVKSFVTYNGALYFTGSTDELDEVMYVLELPVTPDGPTPALAATGLDVAPWLALGLGMLVAGGGVLALRRRSAQH